MKTFNIPVIIILIATTMSSCNIYRKYNRPDMETSGLYRESVSTDTTNMGDLPWQQVFTDVKLQQLIEEGLNNNINLQTALLRVEESRALLTSARLAYTPSLNLSPSGSLSSFDGSTPSRTYQLPVAASWEIDLFGKLLNAKRGARAALLQSESYQQAVRTQVIANIANTYYTLIALDRQLKISEETVKNWQASVETMKALKQGGMVNEAAVVQSEANSYAVQASIPGLRRQIRETENALCLLLGRPAQRLERSAIEVQNLPMQLTIGVPVQLLSNRPDVRQAEAGLMKAAANTNVARASFYPQLTINGTAGWTNSAGGMIVNPGQILLSATAGLVQPLLNRGVNRATLRVAKAQQEEARLAFQLALLNAGNEVSNALYQYETSQEKTVARSGQIGSLERSVEYTEQLLRLGSSTYLEVLTAQQSLLNAQLSQVGDRLEQMQAVVNLYYALGGGR